MIEGKEIPAKMLAEDPFSKWLGVEIISSEIGKVKLGMTIRPEMLNSMGKAHGGIAYSLTDCAFGFSSNSHGKMAVSIESSVNHIEVLYAGDYITAECKLDKTKNKLGFHIVEVTREEELVALFKGVVYRTIREWE